MAQFSVRLQKMVKQASLSLEVDRVNKLERYAARMGKTMNDILRGIVGPAIDALEIPDSEAFNEKPKRTQRSL
ncbi:MAG: hypothetical protein WCH39_04785 [Schlesneria sp.]